MYFPVRCLCSSIVSNIFSQAPLSPGPALLSFITKSYKLIVLVDHTLGPGIELFIRGWFPPVKFVAYKDVTVIIELINSYKIGNKSSRINHDDLTLNATLVCKSFPMNS